MKRLPPALLCLLAAALGSASCAVGGEGSAPVLLITAPESAGLTIDLGADSEKSVPIAFALENGELGTEEGMFHVHVHIAGGSCDRPGKEFNSEGFESPVTAQFGLCPQGAQVGRQTVELTLHNADHTPVLEGGAPVAASVDFTTQLDSTQTGIRITSPANNATVSTTTFPIAFSVTSFTLDSRIFCSPAPCGHVHLYIDGDSCNGTETFNAEGAMSPIAGNLAKCPIRAGRHDVKVELHNDDHSPTLDARGNVISDRITVTAQQ